MGKWYTISVRGKFENKVKSEIEHLTALHGLAGDLDEILILIQQCIILNNDKKKIIEKNAMPGYMFMKANPSEKLFSIVAAVDGVMGIVGGEDNPQTISDEEMEDLKKKFLDKQEEEPEIQISFEKGKKVKIVDGPFKNMTGIVKECTAGKSKMKITMAVLNRPVDVEVDVISAILAT